MPRRRSSSERRVRDEERAADLERARQLQRLELEEDRDARRFRERRRRLDRRAADAPLERPARLEDERHVESASRRRPTLHAGPARYRRGPARPAPGRRPRSGRRPRREAGPGRSPSCAGRPASAWAARSRCPRSRAARCRRRDRSPAGRRLRETAPRLPSALRVPSGKTTTELLSSRRWRISSIALRALSLSPRVRGMSPGELHLPAEDPDAEDRVLREELHLPGQQREQVDVRHRAVVRDEEVGPPSVRMDGVDDAEVPERVELDADDAGVAQDPADAVAAGVAVPREEAEDGP